jgi:hypothetical protein
MSSSRPQAGPFQVITNGNMASATITSTATIIQKLSMVSYDVSWVGTSPVGTITVEVSNTYRENPDGSIKVAGNWTSVSLSASGAVSGNTGNGFLDIEATGAYAMRLKYTKTSGTGTLQATMCAKVA